MNTLAKKLVVAFLVGAGPVFLAGILDLFDAVQSSGHIDTHVLGTVLLSLAAGAVSAGIRYVITAFNFVPGDETVGLNKTADAVEVTKTGTNK